MASTTAPRGGGPNDQVVSIERTADGRGQRSKKIIDENREKYRIKNELLQNTSRDSKGTIFVILENYANVPIRKERLSPTSKARRKASRNKFIEKGTIPDKIKSLKKVNLNKNYPRARLGFVKSIQN